MTHAYCYCLPSQILSTAKPEGINKKFELTLPPISQLLGVRWHAATEKCWGDGETAPPPNIPSNPHTPCSRQPTEDLFFLFCCHHAVPWTPL